MERPRPAQAELATSPLGGLALAGPGRFVVNAAETRPGQPNCKYHGESAREDLLVLSGECSLVVEGVERRLRAWDFVHCPGWTEHVFVGAGDGPRLLLMVGDRRETGGIVYPVSEAAARHGASVAVETAHPREAYAGSTPRVEIPARRDVLPGAPR